MSSLVQRDEAAREAALDVRHGILLQAPAGSGKTTVLVCRVLALLAAGEEPEGILAITFSRKAAAEMRERVMKALHAPDDPRQPESLRRLARGALERDRERGWQLLRNPSRLRIQTFDALNQRLVAQAPVQSGGGGGLAVTENAALLYARAARRILEGAWADAELAGAARLLFEHLDNRWDRFEKLLAELLQQRLQWLPPLLDHGASELADQVELSLGHLAEVAMRDALLHWTELGSASTAALLATTADNLAGMGGELDAATLAWRTQRAPLRAESGELDRWRHACRVLLTDKGEWRKSLTRNIGVPPDDKAFKKSVTEWVEEAGRNGGLLGAMRALQSLPDVPLATSTRAALHALALLMRRAAGELQVEFAESGNADFSYLAGAARQSLTASNEPTDLALRFGAALRHLLVDEFQDTSTEQAQLLVALTSGWSEGDGRTLFLVGDPMQSIYQFRAAEVGVFLRTRAHGIGGLHLRPLELRRNFRSGPGVVDWVNQKLGPLFPPRDDLRAAAISYLESASARPEIPATVQVCAALGTGDAARDEAAEAQRALEIVRAERANQPGCSVAVLVSSRIHAVPIAAALRAAGVPVRGMKLTPLAERHCVRDVLMLARAIQHRGDRTAWLALLRSPLCGLELAELQALAEEHEDSLWLRLAEPPPLPAPTLQRIGRLRAALEPALHGAERQEPLAQRVARTWLRLGGADLYTSDDERADVRSTFAALAALPEVERCSGEDFSSLLADLYADGAGPDDAVQILTMHGAKGLEWDVVIVPGLHRGQKKDRRRLLEWLALPREDQGTDLLFAPIEAAGDRSRRSLGAYIRGLHRRRRDTEKFRLMYVTATRARRALYWLGQATLDDATGQVQRPDDCLLSILWPALRHEFEGLSAQSPPAVPKPVADTACRAPALLERLGLEWTSPASAASPRVERLPIRLRDPALEPEYAWVGATSRAIGTVIHVELQRLAVRQRERSSAGLPEDISAACCSPAHYASWLAELGVPESDRTAGAERIRAALDRTVEDPRGRWLLSHAEHREASSERRLTGVHEGQVVNVIIDRMLVDREGVRWIIDIKTSSHEGGNLQAFIDQEVVRYRPQLQRYAALARRLGEETVRCALYFPMLGVFREL